MANKTAAYDVIWYANKMLERLEQRLTFVRNFSRGFDEQARTKGDTIKFKRPGGFVAQNMPAGAGGNQDLTPESDTIVVNNHKGVQFGVEDKELAFSGDEIIRHHVAPATQAVAEAIESSAVELYKDVPYFVDAAGTLADFVNVRKALNENKVPMAMRALALNYAQEAVYLGAAIFTEADKSAEGGATQREGYLGRKMGIDTYTVPLLGNHTTGTAIVGTPLLQGAHTKFDSNDEVRRSITIDGLTAGTLKRGDTLVIAGHTQRYAVTADVAFAATMVVPITPGLATDYADNAAVTIRQQSKSVNVAHHSEAFALVMAPLADSAMPGVEVGTAVDPQTGLAIRVTRWYDPYTGKHQLKFDALWGVKTVDPNKAVRLEAATI